MSCFVNAAPSLTAGASVYSFGCSAMSLSAYVCCRYVTIEIIYHFTNKDHAEVLLLRLGLEDLECTG